MEMWHLRKLESSFEDARESGVAGHSMTCGVPLPINRDHRVFLSKPCILFVEGEQNKTRNYCFGAFFSKVWLWGVLPRVPALPGEAGGSVLQDLRQVEVQLALPAKNCCQESSEELGEIP